MTQNDIPLHTPKSTRFLGEKTVLCVGRSHVRLIVGWFTLSLTFALITPQLPGATLFWDGDADGSNSIIGGAGTWNTSDFQWDVDADNSNSNNAAWTNGIDIASFGGISGTVTLGGPITVGGLEFTSDGYTITGGGPNTLTLSGPGTIDVAAGVRTAVTADIAGTVGLVKNGNGTLNLGPSNSFTGSTIINAGVIEVYKDESLGSGNGAIQINGGTLSALGNNFYSTRNIEIGASGGTLDVTRNYSNWGSMRLKGVISGSSTLTKTGFGELRLDGDSSGFTGEVIVEQGILRLYAFADRGTVTNLPALGASSYTVRSGGDLQIQYSSIGSTPYYSAINETAPIHMEGGRMTYYSNNSGAVSPWTQNTGDLFLDRGSNRFYINRTNSGSATLLSFGNLTRAQSATVSFDYSTSAGTLGELGNNPLIKFANSPVANDGVLGGWALVNLVDFADYDPTLGVRQTAYNSTDIATAGATDNVDYAMSGTTTIIGDTTVNSLKITASASNSIIEQTNGTTLTIDTGGLLTLGNFTKYIQPESGGDAAITANGGALYVHNAQSNVYINSTIVDGDMPTALVKTQAGALVLYSTTDNTYSGGTYINGASIVYTGFTANRTYFGSGAVYLTRGNLYLRRRGATTSEEGYSVFEGGGLYLDNASQVFDSTGDRFTIDGTSSIGGQSQAAGGGGLNSLTYVAGPVAAGGQVHIDPGATIVHGTDATVMGAGTNTIQNLPNDMQFYFGPGATSTAASTVTIGVGTPWRGLGTDRNTRSWNEGTITVNGGDFELRAMLVSNQNGEGQSSYTLRIGGGSAASAPVITGAASTPLTAHVTGGYVGLDAGAAIYGSIAAGSPLTFQVEAGGNLEVSQENAMGTGDGLASIIVLDGGTFQQYGSSSDATRLAAAETGINGNVTIQARGRFLAQNTNGLSGTGTITFEPRAILQINNNTGWTGSQAAAAVGVNDAIIRIQVDNFGTSGTPLLTNFGIDGTGIYEWATNANAANPSSAGTPILSLDGGLIINDAFDRSLDATNNGFIELKVGGAGGTIASSSGQLFNINEDVELNGLTLTIGYADVIDGDPGLGGVRMDEVRDSSVGKTGAINVIGGAQLRISLAEAIQSDIALTLQAGAWLDVDNSQTLENLIGNGGTSRILGDSTLTLTRAGDYDLNASIGDTVTILQAGGGVLTIDEDSDGSGNLAVSNGTVKIAANIGNTFNLNPTGTGVIDLNGTTTSVRSITGDSTGTIELNGGVLVFENPGTVTIDSGEAVINGPGTIRLLGQGQVRFNQDPSRMTNISQIDIFNGEFRVDGVQGTPDTFLIGAPVINLGDHFATTGGTGSQSFPRLYLVNTETTQTAELNVDGGWITSDLGANDLTIWSGNINFTGAADTNIFDVNDAGTGDQHAVTGVIGGTGGFSKVNSGTLRLEADNTIQGNIYIQRNGVGGSNIDSTLSRGGIRLTEANGALSAANSVIISRDGSFYLNNATDVNLDRVGDSTDLTLRGQGRVRLVGNASSAVSETMGALYVDTGSGKINFDVDDSTPQLTTFTFSSFKRDRGSIAQFQVLDDLTGSFGSPFAASTKAQLFIADAGATPNTAVLYGGGGANGSTNKTLVLGAYGGVNNISNHFMTFDSTNTTELRPLVWDGTPVGSEYFLSREAPTLVAPHQFTRAGLVTYDQNVLINFNTAIEGEVGTGLPGSGSDYGWYGSAPVAILENVAMNSLRFGTNTPTNSPNSNEIGSALVLAPGARLFLGDHVDDGVIGDITTSGSGMILFGRDISGTSPGSNQYIAGGYIDFGTREAIIVNESGNSAFLRSNIVGSGGLTKAGAQAVYLDNSNSYTGITNIAEGALIIRDQNALGGSTLVRTEGAGSLYLELGTNVRNSLVGGLPGGPPPDLFVGTIDTSRVVLYSNSSNNTWGGDVIIDTVDNLGNWVFTARMSTNARDTLNIDGNIYSNEEGSAALTAKGISAHAINADIALNDARLVSTGGGSSTGGIVNINGQFSDNVNGPVSAPVTTENENQVLRFQVGGSNEMIVNVRQQWNAAGQIRVEQGILRYEGDGNFWTPLAAERMDSTNSQSGMRIGGSYGGSNNGTQNAAVILTKAGQVLNIGRIDIGGDGSNNYNAFGNTMLAGTNTSGTVTFGDGTERVFYYGATSSRRFVRDLTVYAAGGGTVELNYRLDDTDTDSHTSFTKIGRGVVNFNGQNDVNGSAQNGDVEQLNMSGGLLRLTNYGHATGRRFDNGAMITFAGGGIEMDGLGAIQNETANYTGAAVVADAAYPAAQTLIAPGGTDVIVTAADFNITMNIGSDSIALTRQSGGTVNFVENATGSGNAVITLEGIGQPADDTAIAWATYGDSYTYNAMLASYTLNALDFAMTSNAAGNIDMFAGGTRQDEDDVAAWVLGNDVSENILGFSGATAVASVNTIHFDFDGAGTIDATAGLEVTSGGIMVSSSVITGEKMISNGLLNAGADADLIIHQYGGGDMTISSVIQDNAGNTPGIGNALVKTGSGNLVLTADNTYTGSTFLNGGQLTISSNTNLGATPGAADADNIYANGGTLRVLADVDLNANRGIMLGGNGLEVSVGPSATLTYNGIIASEPNVIVGYTANPAVGRFDKTGSGTLLLTNVDNTFNGLFDIREGTVKWEPLAALSNGTYAPFGSNSAFLDGTIVHSGATLAIHPLTAATSSNNTFYINEWFTFEGGSTLDVAPVSNATTPHDFNLNLRGVLKFDSLGNPGTPDGFVTPTSLAGATVIDVGRRQINLNDDGGYITGDGGITKTGDSTLAFRENSPEWTGQLVVLEGAVYVYGAGDVLGRGTLPIILGHNLLAEQAGEVVSGNTQVQLLFTDEGGYRDVSTIAQDIIVRADDGAGNQTKRIGARFLANIDEVNYDGNITLRDDLEFYYQDDARDSSNITSSTHVGNSTRSIGTLTNQETVFINFNGNIIGAVGNDITTNVTQGGSANVPNGNATDPFDDFVIRAIFAFNGDNSGWAGNLTIGNTEAAGDSDEQHIVTIGNVLALSANNDVTIRSNATIRTSGLDVIIGNLSAANANVENYIENSSVTSEGSITITQNTDAEVDIVLRDGETVFILQPGESYKALSFKKAGLATLTLTKGNGFTGSTTLAGGTLELKYDADNSMLSDTGTLILNDGILLLTDNGGSHSEIVGSTIINGTVAIERSTGGASILNLNTITRNAGSLRISEDDIATTDNVNVSGILGGWATVGGSWATNSGVLDAGSNGGFIRGLTVFDQDVDRLGGGAGSQVITNASGNNVRIIEDGSNTTPITLEVVAGTTSIYTLLQGANGGLATVDIGAGNTLRIGSGGVLLPDGSSSLLLTNGTLTTGTADDAAGTLFLQSQSSTGEILTVGSVIADNGGGTVDVRTAGPGTTVFSGENTYTGDTLVGSGILAIGDGGSTGTLGAGDVTIEASGILAFNRSDTALNVLNKLIGSGTVVQNGSGTTTLSAAPAAVTKLNFVAADGTLAIGADNAINTTGMFTFGDVNGAATTAVLDVSGGNVIVGGLIVQTDSPSANQLIIGTGRTLTVNGGVTIGADVNASQTTMTATGGGTFVVNSSGATFQVGGATGGTNENRAIADFSGLTNFTANLGAGLFNLGDANTGTASNASEMLLARNSTINAGQIQVGDGSGGGYVHTLTLGNLVNTFNADILNIGSAVNRSRSSGEIKFGAADNTGTLKIRGSDGTSRALINMVNTTGSTGAHMTAEMDLSGHTADILAGAVTLAYRSANSGNATATLTFDQGTLDILTLSIANRGGGGSGNSTATVNLGDSAAPGTPMTTIGSIDMGVNTSTNANSQVTADLNITGGIVNIGTGSGTAINMANADTNLFVDSNINLTGGIITVTGNIIRTGGAGTENTFLTLAGGTLDMSGNSIGTGSENIFFNAVSGTLSNLAELNGGGGLTKITTGKLVMDGVNTYTGVTTVGVNGGTLQFARQTALYNNTPASWTATNLVVNSGGTAAFNVGGAGEFTAGDLDIITALGTATGGFLDGSTLGIDTSNASGAFVYGTVIADTDGGNNSISLNKLGTGTLALTADNTYTGPTTITEGTLQLGNGGSTGSLGTDPGAVTNNGALVVNRDDTFTLANVITGTGAVGQAGTGTTVLSGVNDYTGATTVSNGELHVSGTLGATAVSVGETGGTFADAATLSGSGSIGGAVTVGAPGSLGILSPGGGPGDANATLTLTADNTALTVADGSQIRLGIASPTSDTTPAVVFINGQYEFNGGTYATAADLFASTQDNGGAAGADGAEALAIWNVAPTTSTSHDFLNLTGTDSNLTVGARASATHGEGSILITDAGLSGVTYGQVFNLIDWTQLSPMSFNVASGVFGGGTPQAGDLDLPDLTGFGEFAWDTSAFQSYGIIVVVPEPSRLLLMMVGLVGLLMRRRR